MPAYLYEQVIQSWCQATGMSPWSIDAQQHIELDGHTVGLLYDPDLPLQLDVLFELRHVGGANLAQELLQLNARVDLPHGGCYALHPSAGTVVYRLRLALGDGLDGATLPLLLSEVLQQTRLLLRP